MIAWACWSAAGCVASNIATMLTPRSSAETGRGLSSVVRRYTRIHEHRRAARAEAEAALRRPGSGSGRPWLVIVKNDNHNTFDGVAFALARTLPGVTFERGHGFRDDRIHSTGQAVVWSGQREQAEHYWQQLSDFGLTMAPLSSSG